ncbi:histidine-phosphotransfer domain HPT domain-containing protein [Russula earlei]|uniref:Histidine-phosphotransfer domain HPT domain-containing protein n=1 Tax=Russula earlei TaxID=71964 RepID=A0ACC0U491_9AGAM|nr:histidine-phosphotransfer domain HPT domain-containing protein [Russula earlei]
MIISQPGLARPPPPLTPLTQRDIASPVSLAITIMPTFSSPSPPVATRAIDDTRPLPSAQVTASPSSNRPPPALIPAKSTTVAKPISGPPPVAKERAGSSPPNKSIDREVFDQVLELDEEDEMFSKDMVDAYFVQADKTFNDMDAALTRKDLSELSALGHFLKGSSAALGVSRVQSSCEKIQHLGHLREDAENLTEAEAIVKITKSLARAREEYVEAKTWLDWFYTSYHPGEE